VPDNEAAVPAKLARAEPVIVLNADHPSPSLVEKMARLPIDAVFIDCEQAARMWNRSRTWRAPRGSAD